MASEVESEESENEGGEVGVVKGPSVCGPVLEVDERHWLGRKKKGHHLGHVNVYFGNSLLQHIMG